MLNTSLNVVIKFRKRIIFYNRGEKIDGALQFLTPFLDSDFLPQQLNRHPKFTLPQMHSPSCFPASPLGFPLRWMLSASTKVSKVENSMSLTAFPVPCPVHSFSEMASGSASSSPCISLLPLGPIPVGGLTIPAMLNPGVTRPTLANGLRIGVLFVSLGKNLYDPLCNLLCLFLPLPQQLKCSRGRLLCQPGSWREDG